MLALVIFAYTSSLTNQHQTVVSRPYVDNITSDHAGSDVQLAVDKVSAICSFTDEFAADLCFKPNLIKSKRFSTSAGIRAALRLVPGPEAAASFADLGVAQTPVARPAAQLNDKARSYLVAGRLFAQTGALYRSVGGPVCHLRHHGYAGSGCTVAQP